MRGYLIIFKLATIGEVLLTARVLRGLIPEEEEIAYIKGLRRIELFLLDSEHSK